MKTINTLKPLMISLAIGLSSSSVSTLQASELKNQFKVKNNTRWYAGLNIGQSKLEPKVTVAGGSVVENQSTGYKVYGGYQINKTVALEAFYADLGAARIDIVTDESDVDYQVYGAGLVLSLPMTKRLKLQGKLGYAGLKTEVKAGLAYKQINDSTIYTGAGINYQINKKLSWRLDYDYFDKDYQLLSTGLQYQF